MSGSRGLDAGRDVRRHNLALVLGELVDADQLSRAAIAARTGLTRGTVSSLVEQLIDDGLLRELAAARGAPGRPASPLQLDPSGPAGLGIEIGVDHVAACVVDLTGTVRATRTEPSDHRSAPPATALARAAALADEVRAEAGLSVVGATVAVPGVVSSAGLVTRAPNLPTWSGTVVDDIDGLPTRCGNEADIAALAELWFGAAPRDFVLVSGGVGVGAGIVLDGRPFGGPGGRAGELGHVVVDPAGPPCRCGGRGCLEQVAGEEALLRAAAVPTLDELVAHCTEPRPAAALDAAARALGVALAAAVNLLDVPAVILGGIYPRLGEPLRASVATELGSRVVSRDDVTVRLSAPGTGGALRGAAAAVVRHRLRHP